MKKRAQEMVNTWAIIRRLLLMMSVAMVGYVQAATNLAVQGIIYEP